MKWCFTRYTVGKFWFLFLCLRVKHKSLFWVPILAAGGPYWVLISQKVGSLFQSLGVLISFGNSAISVSPTLPTPPSISLWRPARGGGCVAFVHHHSRHRRHSCWFLADFNRHLRSLDVNDRQRGSKKKWKKVSKNQLLVEFALVKCKLLFQMHWDWKVIVSDN